MMNFSIVVDMNLSPDWIPVLVAAGHNAVHWSVVGDPHALDPELMEWARNNDHLLLTHDLDFGTLLAQTRFKAKRCDYSGRRPIPRDCWQPGY